MFVPFTNLKKQYLFLKNELDGAIQSCFEDARFLNCEKVKLFEADFAKYLDTKHCIACANGSDALEVALTVLGIGEGDEVIVPTHTWITSVSAIVNVGATPILVDTNHDFLLSISTIEQKITQKTKAILFVHLFGNINGAEKINQIAKSYGLYLIEDCAQAHGAKFRGKKAGTFGDMATFSFFPAKNLGAYGDAGAIVTRSDLLEKKARLIINKGQRSRGDFQIWGRNSGMDSIQASTLSVKLKYLNQWNLRRIEIASLYHQKIKENDFLKKPCFYSDGSHVYHQYVLQVKNREYLQKKLLQEGVETNIHYPKMIHDTHMMSEKVSYTDFEGADSYKNNILSLPIYPELLNEEVNYICNLINEFCQ